MRPQRPASGPAVHVDPVVGWRGERLLAAGFAPDLAAELAPGRAIDLHALLGLVDHGCPPELAARILAPLDGGSR